MSQNSESIFVVKRNGLREPYSEAKVLRSMERAGLPLALQPQVLRHIRERLHPDIETMEIYAHIVEFLEKEHPESSLRFNLKQSIFDLGPTGFPFEQYMQRIFNSLEYATKTDQILNGECITHEIDVFLEKDGRREIVEAKFHNQQGIRTDVHVLMYMYARFLDLKNINNLDGVWVVTNTKLSTDAAKYARCKGIKVIGWSYPENNSLQHFVENPKMYPITILNTLTRHEKQSLMNGNIVLCSDLLNTADDVLVHSFFLHKDDVKRAKEQAQLLFGDRHPKVIHSTSQVPLH